METFSGYSSLLCCVGYASWRAPCSRPSAPTSRSWARGGTPTGLARREVEVGPVHCRGGLPAPSERTVQHRERATPQANAWLLVYIFHLQLAAMLVTLCMGTPHSYHPTLGLGRGRVLCALTSDPGFVRGSAGQPRSVGGDPPPRNEGVSVLVVKGSPCAALVLSWAVLPLFATNVVNNLRHWKSCGISVHQLNAQDVPSFFGIVGLRMLRNLLFAISVFPSWVHLNMYFGSIASASQSRFHYE